MSLIDEIREQPEVLARTIELNGDAAVRVARLARDSTHAVIAARGTSDNAGRYAQYVWGSRNGLSVGLATPSLFSVYDSPPRLTDALVVGISQSGQSPDIVSVLEEGRRQGQPTVALTNGADSPLADVADVVIDVSAGPEESVAATKSYTAELAAVALVSEAMAGRSGGLGSLPGLAAMALEQEDEAASLAARWADIDHVAVLGRGFNQATAFELALKLQELTRVLAQPFSTADFVHGPIAVVEPGYPILSAAADGPAIDEIIAVLTRVRERGARLLVITNHPAVAGLTREAIVFEGEVDEWLTPIPIIVIAQLFAYHMTLVRGLDPEAPRGLRKVTRTR